MSTIASGNWGNGITETKIYTQGILGDVAPRYDNEFDDGDATSGGVSCNTGTGATYDLATSHELIITI